MKYFCIILIIAFITACGDKPKEVKKKKAPSKKIETVQKPVIKEKKEEPKRPVVKKNALPKPTMDILVAIKQGNLQEVKNYLYHNPKPIANRTVEYAKHPLYVAISYTKPLILKELLRIYPLSSRPKRDFPLVAFAADEYDGDISCVKILVQNKASLELYDPQERTALFCAAVFGKPNLLEFLLDSGAQVNRTCLLSSSPIETTLDRAIKNGRVECIKILKARGGLQYKDLKK